MDGIVIHRQLSSNPKFRNGFFHLFHSDTVFPQRIYNAVCRAMKIKGIDTITMYGYWLEDNDLAIIFDLQSGKLLMQFENHFYIRHTAVWDDGTTP